MQNESEGAAAADKLIINGLKLYLATQEKGSPEYQLAEEQIRRLEAQVDMSVQARLDEALRLLWTLDNALCSYLRDEDDHTEINGGDAVEWLGQFSYPLGEFLEKNPLPVSSDT